MKFLSIETTRLGVGSSVFVVGGAVRNFVMDPSGGQFPVKDLDLVIDTIMAGRDSEWLAKSLQEAIPAKTSLVTNNYGVAILSISGSWEVDGHAMQGQTIEIANARRESYGGITGQNYKPHLVEKSTIQEDLVRRDFTINSLLYRLSDLANGPVGAPVLDLLGNGLLHLRAMKLHTPQDPDKTFSDDPTRMLRAVKFSSKYGFSLSQETAVSILRNASKLKQMPWDAVRKILGDDILGGPNPRQSIVLLQNLGLSDVIKELIVEEPGFATALSRGLNDLDIYIAFDLLDQGWTMATPVSFLSTPQVTMLRDALYRHEGDREFEKRFLGNLKRPVLDQVRLFETYSLKGKDRGALVPLARSFLLEDPSLVENPQRLESLVEGVLQKQSLVPLSPRD